MSIYIVVMHRLIGKISEIGLSAAFYNICNWYLLADFGKSLINAIFNYLTTFSLSKENLAEVEKYVKILHETCRNWVKLKHRIGYQYQPLFELKYWLIG